MRFPKLSNRQWYAVLTIPLWGPFLLTAVSSVLFGCLAFWLGVWVSFKCYEVAKFIKRDKVAYDFEGWTYSIIDSFVDIY